MDIAGMVDNLALSGVLPGSSGIPATELAALDLRAERSRPALAPAGPG
jgi:hypothetical protein|tara:strand:- start:550 stop:693 length:144 start_codon:yes stop_codon:yes gene_type:complete